MLRAMQRAVERKQRRPAISIFYKIDPTRMGAELASRFVQLDHDEDAKEFLEECSRTTICSLMYARFLQLIGYTFSDAIAIAGTNRMHVISKDQAKILLAFGGVPGLKLTKRSRGKAKPEAKIREIQDDEEDAEDEDDDGSGGHLLDVGAGEGRVTLRLKPLFDSTTTTEVSDKLVSCLRNHGLNPVLTTEPSRSNIPAPGEASNITLEDIDHPGFEVVSLLNVLDRCSKPLTLLRTLRDLIKGSQGGGKPGRLLLAVVLPFRPTVEGRDGKWNKPEERVDRSLLRERGFEESVELLVEHVLRPCGYEV
ncbi:Methyltransferase-like protein 9, partial [Irineochytrium annulatum]